MTEPATCLKLALDTALNLEGDDIPAVIVRALKTGHNAKRQPLGEVELEWLAFLQMNISLGSCF